MENFTKHKSFTSLRCSSHLLEVSYEVRIPKSVDFLFFANCLREEFDVVDVALK